MLLLIQYTQLPHSVLNALRKKGHLIYSCFPCWVPTWSSGLDGFDTSQGLRN